MIPCDSYINSDFKEMQIMNVRNIEGWNPSGHPSEFHPEILFYLQVKIPGFPTNNPKMKVILL